MKNYLFPVLALAMFLATGWHSYNYGVSVTELAQTGADNTVMVAAEVDRKQMAAVESESVKSSISNSRARDAELNKLKLMVAGYEAEKQKDRDDSCNLSTDTVASMQQFARRGDGKRMGSGSGIDTGHTAYGPGSAGSRYSGGDGGFVGGKRGDHRRSDLQSYRYSTGGASEAKAVAAT